MKYNRVAVEVVQCRRAPHGARGLKYAVIHPHGVVAGRAPHGARGLKSTFSAG